MTCADPTLLLQRAAAALRAADLATAERSCRMVLKVAPNHPGALHLLGLVARRAGHQGPAIDLFRKAVAAAPRYAEAWANLGGSLLDRGETVEARQAFERALAARPQYWPAESGLARALAASGETAAAVRLLQASAAAHPELAAPSLELGNLLQTESRLPEAIDAYTEALARGPALNAARSNRAAARLKAGDADGALADADAYLASGAKSANVVAYRVLALQWLGETDAARYWADVETMIYRITPDVGPGFADQLEADIRTHQHLIDDWDPRLRAARGGKVIPDLTRDPTPTIAAFLETVRRSVDKLAIGLPSQPDHPFFGAKPDAYRMIVWANILASGGHQAAHIHNYGWISGVYYPSVPADIDGKSDAGWLSFGRPGYDLPAPPQLETRSVKPEAGAMVLFPSYLWHHTVPLETGAERLSIAFDVVPT